MEAAPKPTRERIIDAAGKLFYADGVHSVSMDAIAEASAVTKRTLYYHFRSKDDLIAAWLETRDQPNLAAFRHWFSRAEGDVAARIRAIFTALGRAARRGDWKGCGFLRISVELVKLPGHPAVVAARAHKKRVDEWLETVLEAAGHGGHTASSNTASLARQIVLLMDGAFADALLYRDAVWFDDAGLAAETLIRAELRRRAQG
ncbi:TetR/AcrR family transcriptional regulator [Pseudomonas sp. GX19020]|uniref:TetR/AcrR family transcriptional regulator n=1 Tax=Pseudomonas sp. GX19020 TaxID=2942277 RepID=UPI00201975C8|nr:TetR/AcrR family transcriptional regulator [Pseudomonas sp. GX19020]MCL4065845.1 TetR/AcrR family transcriptional regulator [Pseudomonas sp. GX19020]